MNRKPMVLEMTTYHQHIPVLLDESVEGLITDKDGLYIDGTLGGGGHSKEILKHLGENGRLYGIDQDDEALEAASSNIGDDPRFTPIKGNFGYLSTLLPPQTHGQVAGILLDLGVSTHQIKEAERGFSFQEDGPLDMRMGNLSGVSAYQVVNEYEYEKLRDVIFHYGEEKQSRQIARAIIEKRPIETTGELRDVVSSVVNKRFEVKSLARVFQGIRIEVNRELDMLKRVMEESLEVLKPGGRIVAISYHSLEDRIVKRFFKAGNFEGKVEKDFYGNPISPIKPVNKQVITPKKEEVSVNPASRSAKLRIAEKIEGGDS
ncbi:MAG: 16S rRNA (cytosine(1402)-N(4))-methyltransferase RsmH [Gracilimonas sp.]|uniref:16S rRNA (cytosine(1402)-N(4))-methyltransferase RsmH n=2 Tax=Gracilimonas TaxID=649462 RepID=UPI001B15C43F|nr:16S rRNA (cytosine(1402)-N(4))-methyltransferase RsmH [Gracilimonas sp.]MBO6585646.1 16S rRNA (cytosine(1402)-N(4))-methyltransferase RsmH [Gracilimonas sp.]MBO6616643.1 16S rRNA (cytosine(1402)-N(4))-methyltransferase RsmH [Gracilimonas sp.]